MNHNIINSSEPLVSVIIPVYNTGQYVGKAIQSICQQSFKNIEIIVINDGSTDNSLEVISYFAKKDNRITIISQSNKGVSAARNKGIKLARGKYLYFMDSDDMLDYQTLEICLNLCEKNDLDYILFDAEIFNEDEKHNKLILKYDRSKALKQDTIYTGIHALELQLKQKCYTPSVCLIFIKTSLLHAHNLCFKEEIIHEDQLFVAEISLKAERVQYLCDHFFKRRIRSNSIMTSNFGMKNINSYLYISNKLHKDVLWQNKKIKFCIQLLITQMLNAAFYNCHEFKLKERIKLLYISFHSPYFNYISFRTRLILLLKKYIIN